MNITVERIREAAVLLKGRVLRTPSLPAKALSDLTGVDVVLKLENLQHTGSFKVRGALVKLLGLDDGVRRAGVVAASAGNHAQGVAYHARELGISTLVVMPEATPFTKVSRTEALGARVLLHGEDLKQAQEHARRLADEGGLGYVHPYDDPDIMAGQGTIGLEMMADDPDLDAVIVPIGGGGLISGIATAAKAVNPDIEILGAEAALYPSMYRALGGSAPEGGGATVAEGIAVKTPGRLTIPVVEDLISRIVLLDEADLEQALRTLLDTQRIVAEGAGAAPLAALMQEKERFQGRKVGLVVSGGNIDPRLLSSILMRGLVREGRLTRLGIEIPDRPGALARITGIIGDGGGNIVEVTHQRLFYDIPVKETEVDVVVETVDAAHVWRIVDQLSEAGFPVRILGATSDGTPAHICQT